MKNFFKNLLGNGNAKNTESAQVLSNAGEYQNLSDISEDLFIENEAPVEEMQTTPQKVKSHLARFLERDFYSMGFQDGYMRHSSELLDTTVRKIKVEFRLCIDKQSQEVNEQIMELEKHLIDIDGISEKLTGKVMLSKKKFQQDFDRLEKETQKSAIDEGLVMIAIHQYNEGYYMGVSKYQNENLLIEGTGLF
jgi:hypothetical protein